MSNKIFSFIKFSENSIVASQRIAKFLGETLDLEISCGVDIADQDLETIMIVNGAYGFAGKEILAALGSAIERAKRTIWIQNDYTIVPPKDESGAESPFRKAFRNRYEAKKAPVDYWTTCENYATPGRTRTGHVAGPGSRYVNWNCLTFDGSAHVAYDSNDTSFRETMVYYGSYRKDREAYFARYFSNPHVRTLISCPNDKFFQSGIVHKDVVHYDKITMGLLSFLSKFGLGLYLEDKRSHVEFHSPANRFYEMLSAGLPMVFQPESSKMMAKAGIDVDDFVAWNASEIPAMMEKRDKIRDEQRALWFDKCELERRLLPDMVRSFWAEYRA